jgi:ribosomal protein S18 acetylase RimI-like enzyme
MITITEATAGDIPVIQDLAERIWPEAFGEILSPGQITYMLDWMYSPESLSGQMADGHRFLLASDGDGCAGYCSYQVTRESATAKLHKIYVLASAHGKGVGAALLTEVIRRVRQQRVSRLRLNVNRQNRAVGFYEKFGFKIVDTEDNDIGRGYFMNDYVMEVAV